MSTVLWLAISRAVSQILLIILGIPLEELMIPSMAAFSKIFFVALPDNKPSSNTLEHSPSDTTDAFDSSTRSIDGKKVEVVGDTVKTKSSFRTLPLIPAIRTKLLELKAEQERNQKLCGNSYNKVGRSYIYVDVLGNRIKPDYLSGKFPKFLEKNGFKRMRFHDLRHSCASLLLANGVPLKHIQDWLGHSDFTITANTYAHLDFSAKHITAEAMSWIGETSLAVGLEN
jgi:hypothetical protein